MTQTGQKVLGKHAAVLGGSVAGLLAARVLTDSFERVTLIERDALEDSSEPRKGVPQGRQAHALLQRGRRILEGLFPGLIQALLDGGAVPVDFGAEQALHHYGAWKASTERGLITMIGLTRPFLEHHIRRRVLALPTLRLMDSCDVRGLVTSNQQERVTGVRVQRHGQEAEVLETDLVIDATGRGSQTSAWLEAMGRGKVQESTFKVDVCYATRLFERPASATQCWWKIMYIVGKSPASKRNGLILPVEGGRWVAMMAGVLGDHPPGDDAGWMEFARALAVPDIYNTLSKATPLGDIAVHKFPSDRRRHYELMRDFPDGLAVLGDAHCSFNPIYAQGITTGAMGAEALSQHLARASAAGGQGLPVGFTRGFQARLARVCDDPWVMSTEEDLRHPETEGPRPFGLGVRQWYLERFHGLTAFDPDLTALFYRVMHLELPPKALLGPAVAWKVLTNARPQRKERETGSTVDARS